VVVKQYSVDTHRVYLSGASNGACAVWCLLELDPKPWAAAVPIAGAGDPSKIAAAHRVPIWNFHGDKDTTILPQRSREMIAALKAAGGNPKYTEVSGGSHVSVIKKGYTEPDLLPWLFEQKRK
jgi:predicted peptidase